MFYPATAASHVTSFVTPQYPMSRAYYPAAPMSAVIPGQHYYPAMHGHAVHGGYPTAAPVMMSQGYPGYYPTTPTVIVSSRSGRHRHGHSRSRSRSRGFMGYLWMKWSSFPLRVQKIAVWKTWLLVENHIVWGGGVVAVLCDASVDVGCYG